MGSLHPYIAVLAVGLAIFTISIIEIIYSPKLPDDRSNSIDGLRGYLAFFVFLHHSSVWYVYLKTGVWQAPKSRLYDYFGSGSVILFFMITSFLFFSKILDSSKKPIDWTRLYISRICRIGPLYYFAIGIVFLIVIVLSSGSINERLNILTMRIIMALSLGAFALPDINNIKNTYIIMSGVLWTLSYEWFFYCLLPLIALLNGKLIPKKILIYPLLSLIFIFVVKPNVYILLPFIGGMIAALLSRSRKIKQVSNHILSSILILALLTICYLYLPEIVEPLPIFMLAMIFTLIASGNTLFSILNNKTSRLLGEISYSVYLLHGIILFVIFNFCIGTIKIQSFTLDQYSLIILSIVPLLIIISYITNLRIEKPGIKKTDRITNWYKRTFHKN